MAHLKTIVNYNQMVLTIVIYEHKMFIRLATGEFLQGHPKVDKVRYVT